MRTLALTSLTVALPIIALPTTHLRRSNACPADSVLDAPSFTLLALDVADSTVARALTLSGVHNTTVLVANDTDSTPPIAFTMTKGALVSDEASSLIIPTPGGLLEFGDTTSPAAAYCDVYSTSPHGTQYPYTLGVNGDTTSLSICTSSSSNVNVVVFEPTESTSYNQSSCTPVVVHIIQ
ncbi:unnamed protein product [Peniophora sp. CBMAI 1063]|nr:unnamed protein product [Peniophora sp. CBMAI 1063]